MFGRNGEALVPIIAPQSPGDCFDAALGGRADRGTYRTPVMLLSDGCSPTAPSRGGSPTSRTAAASTPTSPPARITRWSPASRTSGPTCATRRPGPAVGDPRHPGPRAPHRRAGEGRRPRQHLLRPGQPRLHGPDPAGQGRPDRGLAAADGGRRPRRAGQGPRAGLGVDVRSDRGRRTPSAQGGLPRRPGAPAPLNPFPNDLGEILSRYDKVLIPEMNLGQLSC